MAKTRVIYRRDPYSGQSELYVSNGEEGHIGVVSSLNTELDRMGVEGLLDVESGEFIGFYLVGFHRWTKSEIERLRRFPELEKVRFTWEEENVFEGNLLTILKIAFYEFVLERSPSNCVTPKRIRLSPIPD